MNSYELVLLFNPELGEEKIGTIVSKIENKIKTLGGELERTDKWGSRKLVSTIRRAKKLTQAYYAVAYFKAQPSLPAELQNYLKVTENIVRYSVVRAGERPLAEIGGATLKAEGGIDAVDVGEIMEAGPAPDSAKTGEAGGES